MEWLPHVHRASRRRVIQDELDIFFFLVIFVNSSPVLLLDDTRISVPISSRMKFVYSGNCRACTGDSQMDVSHLPFSRSIMLVRRVFIGIRAGNRRRSESIKTKHLCKVLSSVPLLCTYYLAASHSLFPFRCQLRSFLSATLTEALITP